MSGCHMLVAYHLSAVFTHMFYSNFISVFIRNRKIEFRLSALIFQRWQDLKMFWFYSYLKSAFSTINKLKTFFARIHFCKETCLSWGSGIPELKNRVTDYDVIKPSKDNCDVIGNFSWLGNFKVHLHYNFQTIFFNYRKI